jgi:hypothetical protein
VRQQANRDPGDSGNYGVKLNWYSEALNNTEFGFYYVRYTSRFPSLDYNLSNGGAGNLAEIGQQFADDFTSQASYGRGIQMVAMSYNTTLEEPGIAVNGEFSYKMDVPGGIYGTTPYLEALCQYYSAGIGTCGNQMNSYLTTNNGNIPGSIRLDQVSTNFRLTKIFFAGMPFVSGIGAESITAISETSINYITNLPDSGTLNMSPAITNACGAGAASNAATTCDVPSATKVSSYENILLLVSYPAAFGSPINLTPGIYYGMTIQGNSPIAAGPQSGFKATNISLKAEYQQNLTATLNFAKQWGAGYRNTNADKDFVGLTVNYTF